MGTPDDGSAQEEYLQREDTPDEVTDQTTGQVSSEDELPVERTQGQQGLTAPGPPSDPSSPTG